MGEAMVPRGAQGQPSALGPDGGALCVREGETGRATHDPWMTSAGRPQRRATQGDGLVIWFTGLSGAGKSTLAEALTHRLRERRRKVETLDGDLVRTGLSRGLGFTREDRDTNVARIAFVAHLLARNGVIVITAAISPFRSSRDAARQLIGDFIEVHVAAPLEECIRRDVKGLYRKAIAGGLKEFTGISDPYEEPLSPELRLDTSTLSIDGAVGRVLALLERRGHLGSACASPPSL